MDRCRHRRSPVTSGGRLVADPALGEYALLLAAAKGTLLPEEKRLLESARAGN